MRSENIGRRYDLKCRIKIELLFHDIQTNALERQERRMPFVHVKHVRLNSEGSERFHSANPEHDLLTHAHLKIAAIKLGSNQSILGFVFRNIRVEEVDVYPSDAQFPNPGKNFAVQNPHRDNKLRLAPANFSNRQVIEVLIEVNRLLNAIFVDLLPEIAVSIKETDRNEIQIKIAGRLAVVAGEDAQATGVIWDRFVKTKFGGKIGNRILDRASSSGFSISIVSAEILFEGFKNLLELAHKIFVLRQLFQPGLPRKLQHAHGVVIGSVPQLRIEMPEESARRRLPCPPKIKTHLPQRLQRRRENGSDIVSLKSWHTNRWMKNSGDLINLERPSGQERRIQQSACSHGPAGHLIYMKP